jgi:glucan phosphoethanolaminetransferase (alkaline phosphatase superfamily)
MDFRLEQMFAASWLLLLFWNVHFFHFALQLEQGAEVLTAVVHYSIFCVTILNYHKAET